MSGFIEWLRYNPPMSAELETWAEFDADFQKNAPMRYFIVKTIPRKVIYPVTARWERAVSWCRYRIVRYHIVDTGLKPDYYEIEELMLHSNFNILKNFVEQQKAWMQYICHDEIGYDVNPVLKRIPYYVSATFRSRELGEQHLEWESTLDDPTLPRQDRNDGQAKSARETLELYRWWVDVRPSRIEPDYPTAPDDLNDDDIIPYMFRTAKQKQAHPEYAIAVAEWSKECSRLEQEWNDEDDEMLIRLMKLRKSLWT